MAARSRGKVTKRDEKNRGHSEDLNLHDDNLVNVKVCLPKSRANTTRIEFLFCDDSTREAKRLSFKGCANVRYIMDFDVLTANWFAQTEGFDREADPIRMRKFVQAQVAHWHVRYMPPQPKDKPIRKKLSSIRSYRLFRIRFFGGTAEILAKNLFVDYPKLNATGHESSVVRHK
jgi:hypothetical protein